MNRKITRRGGTLAAALAALAVAGLGGAAFAQQTAPRHDYWPGREKAVPHVSGDEKFSNTYRYWRDAEALAKAKSLGLMSHEMNFKDFRWQEKSFDAEPALEKGRAYYLQKGADGKSCASCHGDNGDKLKGVHSRYPRLSEAQGRVVTLETQIRHCAEKRLGHSDWKEDQRANVLTSFYLGKLSDGHVINVDVSRGEMKAAYEKGRDLFFKRTGHFHFACASCHTPPTAGSYLRGQRPTTFFGDAAQYPIYHFPYQLAGDDFEFVFTMQHQIKSCQLLSRMAPGVEGSRSMTAIEVFLKASANGYPMSIPTAEYNMDTNYLDR